ncbi:MAG TPA: hypothetical protein VF843_13060 [Streptosporangiaceae bacterium]
MVSCTAMLTAVLAVMGLAVMGLTVMGLAVAGLAVVGPGAGPVRAATAQPRTLRLGMRGTDVRALQHKLA